MKHYVLAFDGVENYSADSNDIIFTIKDKKLYLLVITLLTKDKKIKSYQNLLAKGLKYQCIGMNIKQKMRIKIWQIQQIFSRIKLCRT